MPKVDVDRFVASLPERLKEGRFSPNDVRAVQELVQQRDGMLAALKGALGRNGCCCEFGVGNPMVRDHSAACKALRAVVAYVEGQG